MRLGGCLPAEGAMSSLNALNRLGVRLG